MGLFFLGSWGAQLVAGTSAYNSDRLQNLLAPVSIPQYVDLRELLEPNPPELAVGVPRGRQHGRPQHLPAPAWVAGVEAGGVAAHRDRRGGLSRLPSGQIRVGISGWTYPRWRGDFYPTGLPHTRELAYAAERMTSVEVNGSFYSLQRPTSYARWRDATPDGFVFAVKGSRFITHMKQLVDIDVALANFWASGVLALGPKLGPVLWQLAGPDPVRRRPARGLLRPAPPLDVRGGWSGSRARREGPGVPRPGRRRGRAAGPSRSRGEARQLRHARKPRTSCEPTTSAPSGPTRPASSR